MDNKLEKLARQIAKLIKDENQTQVAIGDFTSPPAFAASPGPGIQAKLAALFTKFELGLNQKAFLIISGQSVLLRGRDAPLMEGWVAVSVAGSLLALAEVEKGELRPRRIFNLAR